MNSEKELFTLLAFAIQAATEAGEYIAHFVAQQEEEQGDVQLIVQAKTAGDSLASQVVTDVDLAAQEIILKHILPTCKKYDLGLLTEELADDGSRLTHKAFWSIDPLDGTLPFIEQTAGFAVSIALVSKRGKPLLAVVYDPTTASLYHKITGGELFKNGVLFTPKIDTQSKVFTLVCDRSFLSLPHYSSIIAEIEALVQEWGYTELRHISYGGAVMNALWVLENAPALYLKLPKKAEGGGSRGNAQ